MAEQSVPPRRLVPDDQLGYLHDGQWFPAEQRTAPRTAAQEALDEFDNIRWDDIWQRVNASGEDDLARWSKKYAGYVRSALVRAAEQSVPPLDADVIHAALLDSGLILAPVDHHSRLPGRQRSDLAAAIAARLVPQPSERSELARPADTALREALKRHRQYATDIGVRDHCTEACVESIHAALAAKPSAEQPGEEER